MGLECIKWNSQRFNKNCIFIKIKKFSLGYDRDSNNPIEGLECIDIITVVSFLTNSKGYAFKCLCFVDFFKLNFVVFFYRLVSSLVISLVFTSLVCGMYLFQWIWLHKCMQAHRCARACASILVWMREQNINEGMANLWEKCSCAFIHQLFLTMLCNFHCKSHSDLRLWM